MIGADATISALSTSAPAYRAQAAGLPQLTLRWFEGQGAGSAKNAMSIFERDLNGGCDDNRTLAQQSSIGTRVSVYVTTCPSLDPPYQLWWLEALDNERSRVLLVATPSRDGGQALLAGGERLLNALGISNRSHTEQTPSPSGRLAPPKGALSQPGPSTR